VTPGRGPYIRHHPSHAQLIRHGEPGLATPEDHPALDAIVVPASRPAYHLDHAITLARATRCRLVLLCSRDTHATEVHALLAARSFSAATVVEIPRLYDHGFFKFETTGWIKKQLPYAYAVRDSDLSVKRNVGLVLARMLGWQRIFFMDDDIRDLDASALMATVSLLGEGQSPNQRYYSAGMSVTEFPDNSVVCHARRMTREYQDVFVSGSALAVDCTAPFAFFPDIYNEDWFFFYRDVAGRRLGSSGHTATQLRYDPFANPRRAEGQEFGDVIAEGLYALLDEGLGAEYATADRWNQFLLDRKRILDQIIDRSDKAPRDIREKMTRAVATARRCLEEIHPDMCVEYIAAWRDDLKRWEDLRDTLPRVDSVGRALDQLGLSAAVMQPS
jgi:hypothetical protein